MNLVCNSFPLKLCLKVILNVALFGGRIFSMSVAYMQLIQLLQFHFNIVKIRSVRMASILDCPCFGTCTFYIWTSIRRLSAIKKIKIVFYKQLMFPYVYWLIDWIELRCIGTILAMQRRGPYVYGTFKSVICIL